MSSTDLYPPADLPRGAASRPSLLSQAWAGLTTATAWLDERGRGAWIALTVASFFVAPPLGVALLLFTLGTGRMFGHRHYGDRHEMDRACGRGRMRGAWEDRARSFRTAVRPSGNEAFDSYKAETLRRLEDEQRAFEEFLARLRKARDKAEFDEFMGERARKASDVTGDDQAA